jgi:hypothetical protein
VAGSGYGVEKLKEEWLGKLGETWWYDEELFDQLPEALLTLEFCIEAVGFCNSFFGWLTEKYPELLPYEVCLAAVKAYGNNLSKVPDAQKTEELYHIAVKTDPGVICVTPEEFKTLEFCVDAISRRIHYLREPPKHRLHFTVPWKYVPEAIKSDVDFISGVLKNAEDKWARELFLKKVKAPPSVKKLAKKKAGLNGKGPNFES